MTGISWADETWNPVAGCTPVSAGCAHCYAARTARRLERIGMERYRGVAQPDLLGRPAWSGRVRCLPDALEAPWRWTRPRRVFLGSMSDVFHERVPNAFLDRIWSVMEDTDHTYLVLTKRPERLRDYVMERRRRFPAAEPRDHIWLGASIENAAHVDRLGHLLDLPSCMPTFLSLEPLLGPVAGPLGRFAFDRLGGAAGFTGWIVAGGESGPGARPMRAEWVRGVRGLAEGCGIPFHFKQWGPRGRGRVLDGRTWDDRVALEPGFRGPCRTCGRAPACAHRRCRACLGRLRRVQGAA